MANRSRMMFPDSGLVVGPSHSDGGVYASVANGPDVELEGGEFIINKEATEDFLPLIKQINDIGRMEQMDNTDNAQNAHSAIDALIASASTQMMPGGGMVAPKTPMYQKGGKTKTLRMTIPVSRDIKREGDMFTAQTIMSIPAEQVGGEEGLRYYLSSPQRSQEMQNALTKSEFDVRNKMAFTPEDSLPAALVEGYFDRQNKKSPLGFLQGLLNREQGGMIQYEEGGPLHSRRMFNQGTGFDKKKSDLDNDGKISEYEKKRGMAIAKSMKNQMQMGGMIGMQQPMMQRPMNPAMNLSPMQRMGNDMPPMMYQEGGAVADKTRVELPAQIVLDNLARRIGSSSDIQTPNDLVRYLTTVRPAFEVSSPEDNENIENFFKMLESIDAVPKSRKSMQMGGQVQLRKQAEMKRSKTPELNILFPDLTPSSPPDISGFNEPNISETPMRLLIDTGKVKKEVGDINRSKGFKNAINYNALLEELDKYFPKNLSKAQEGGMISNNNLMGAMANDRRVAALQPDVYSSKMKNGMTVEQKMMVPKLAEAVLPVYGVETPLSRRQSSMLKKNAVSPSALNPNVKGLVNRLLVQRLANETT